MMFENLEELLKTTDCRVELAIELPTGERWLYWEKESRAWVVSEHRPYGKKDKTLYEGNDAREAMQFLR